MALSIARRLEGEPQEIPNKGNFPLQAVVFEPGGNELIDALRASRGPAKPSEALEPEPFSLNELEWKRYEKQRDAARKYAEENDLRGTF